MSRLAPVPSGRPRRLVYLGTPAMAVPPLRALVAAGFDVALVVTRPDRRRGRGGATSPSPVKEAALDLGLAVTHDVDDVLGTGAELGVVVAFGQLIRRHVLEELPMVNLHFSLLPRWRGAAPVERAYLAGDATTGVCLMQLEEGLDTGPVFARAEVAIDASQPVGALRGRLVEVGTAMLVDELAAGLGRPVAQSGEPTYAAKLTASDLRIDWSAGAGDVARVVGLGGAWTTFRGQRLKVLAVEAEPGVGDGPAGTIVAERVATPDGWVRLATVQPEGRSPVPASAWVNGARLVTGDRLGDR